MTMAPATAEPELSFTAPWMAPGVLRCASADWADANPGINIIQSASARHGSIGRNAHGRTSFAVRLNQTAIRNVVICSCWRFIPRRHRKRRCLQMTRPMCGRFQRNGFNGILMRFTGIPLVACQKDQSRVPERQRSSGAARLGGAQAGENQAVGSRWTRPQLLPHHVRRSGS